MEVAKSQKDRSQGLMYRKELKKNHGMLVEFPKIDYTSFWMKNTYIPLSIGFFDKDRRLLQVIDMKPAQGPVRESKLKNYRSQSKGKYALEVNIGWFKRHKIKTGSRFQMK